MTIRIKESKLREMIKNSVLKNLGIEDIKKDEQPRKLRRFAEKKQDKEEAAKEEVAQALQAESGVKIVNAEGTTDDHPENTTTWKEIWEEETGVSLEEILDEKDGKFLCPGHEHHKKGDDGYVEAKDICGCHVQKADANGNIIDDTMYITPMCKGCNQRNDVFKVGDRALVNRYKKKYTFHEKRK